MLDQLKIGNILFLDIETVPAYPDFQDVPDPMKYLWEKKCAHLRKENEPAAELYDRAGIYAEFGRIICICTGMVGTLDERQVLRIKSFFHEQEAVLLQEFATLISKLGKKKDFDLCAHNGREFDIPYIARRMLINRVELPALFDLAGKRPWEIRLVDTMDLWKFGDYKHYTSLELLTSLFGIENPKTDVHGSQVAGIYWKDKDLPRIVEYCRHDVIALAQLLLRFKGQDMLLPENIIVLDD